MPFPSNPALEAAVIADCEDDLPRLVYADWLDEHGDAARAAFIRTQIALHDKHPAAADFVDLEVAQEEAVVQLAGRTDLFPPPVPGLHFPSTLGLAALVEHGYFERGFPAVAQGNVPEWVRQVHQGIPLAETVRRMVADTTLRGLAFPENLTAINPILTAREIRSLTSFAFGVDDNPSTDDLAMVGRSPMVRHLRRFSVSRGWRTHSGFRTLAGLPFGKLTRLDLPSVAGGRPAVNLFMKAQWVKRLREVRMTVGAGEPADTLVKGLAALPHLHTLVIAGARHLPLAAFRKGGEYPALGRLELYDPDVRGEQADDLAAARFPRLADLKLFGDVPGTALKKLAAADWFAGLRRLEVSSEHLPDAGVRTLAAAPCLRWLVLHTNGLGEGGLRVVAAAFPELRSLEIGEWDDRQSPEVAERFVARLATSHLRSLTLKGFPLDHLPAVRALAGNPALSNLTLLRLENAAMTADGVESLVTSPHLQRLLRLDFLGQFITHRTTGGAGLAALLDPAVLPNLVSCGMPNGVSDELRAKLEAARPGCRFV